MLDVRAVRLRSVEVKRRGEEERRRLGEEGRRIDGSLRKSWP